jgi:RNA-directed DNA polymerase
MQAPSLANGTKSPTDWQAIDWHSANRQVRNLRQRIFRASKEGNLKKVRSLQKLMLRSYANTVVSVRRVTVDNAGGKTAGVDKEVALTSKAKAALVDKLLESQPWRVKPARRIYIPKQSGAKRPLGIPMYLSYCTSFQKAWESHALSDPNKSV